MPKTPISGGVAHTVPDDVRKILTANPEAREKWNSLTPLARNEWICWVTAVKKIETRKEHIERLREDLLRGKRRPCCWVGCIHRTDKPMNSSQKFMLSKKSNSKQVKK